MDQHDDIEKFIARLSPEPVCDDCIAQRLGAGTRQKVGYRTRELAGSSGFERGKDDCSLCGEERMVTRRK